MIHRLRKWTMIELMIFQEQPKCQSELLDLVRDLVRVYKKTSQLREVVQNMAWVQVRQESYEFNNYAGSIFGNKKFSVPSILSIKNRRLLMYRAMTLLVIQSFMPQHFLVKPNWCQLLLIIVHLAQTLTRKIIKVIATLELCFDS